MTKTAPPTRLVGVRGIAGAVMALVVAIVAAWEGYIPKTYLDPVGIPTACYGHTGPDVTPGRTFTKAECDELLRKDIAEAHADVQRCIRVPMRPHQEAALTSFTFNVGGNALCASTLAAKANAGDWRGACAELDRWVYAGGKKLRGLINRRAAERALCEGRP